MNGHERTLSFGIFALLSEHKTAKELSQLVGWSLDGPVHHFGNQQRHEQDKQNGAVITARNGDHEQRQVRRP